MVRLNGSVSSKPNRPNWFQFLYGAIECGVNSPLSFFYCCFNSSMVRLNENVRYFFWHFSSVSIPLWCDWMKSIHKRWFVFRCVSIPLWCDWMYIIWKPESQYFMFQFLYGAIEWQKKAMIDIPESLFQFLYGAIEWSYIKKRLIVFVFQFLYGAIECGNRHADFAVT